MQSSRDLPPPLACARRLTDPQSRLALWIVHTLSRSPSPILSARRRSTRISSRGYTGFTAREATIAALLLRGRSPSEVAGELAMSDNTVRIHIRHVFDKIGVERMSDLVRLTMQGPGVRGR